MVIAGLVLAAIAAARVVGPQTARRAIVVRQAVAQWVPDPGTRAGSASEGPGHPEPGSAESAGVRRARDAGAAPGRVSPTAAHAAHRSRSRR